MSVRIAPRAVGLALVSTLVLTFSVTPLRSYLAQRAHLSGLRTQMIQLDRQNADLRQGAIALQDPVYLEQLSRQCLGMTRPGEIAFVTVPEHGAPTPPSC